MEGLGVAFLDSVMTLFAFLPILWSLSKNVTELPFFRRWSTIHWFMWQLFLRFSALLFLRCWL
jgi:ABC-type long-subunit fatty acid transport system fused permease/ATPase subunit